MKKMNIVFITLAVLALVVSACIQLEGSSSDGDAEGIYSASPQPWSEEASSSVGDEPDYGIVFPQDRVNEITIIISPDNWQAMLDDLTELYGEPGSGQSPRAGGPPPQEEDNPAPPGEDHPAGAPAGRPADQGMFIGGADDQNPIWVEAEISFEGQNWEHVGVRFKGNSSLKSTWGAGSLKLPFKLDFDQYEDEYPETENQRFYGFKQLSLSSNFHDDSFLHEKIAADLLRDAGVPAAHTAFYSVSVDYGEGPVYFGLYTAVEIVDDTVIETQFSDDSGNVYKPEGAGATFAEGSFSEASFDKETNQEEDDYSDILALYDALHSETRISDPESWREGLKAVFNVDTFLNWLAVNTVIQNWDCYGVASHNYYLYNDPESGQLVWIPWDNNQALDPGSGTRKSLPLDLSTVGDEWPLISYLRDDPVYYQKYLAYLEAFLDEVFILEEMEETYQYYHDLIAPYVLAESEGFKLALAPQVFDRSLAGLVQHTSERIETTRNFLADQ